MPTINFGTGADGPLASLEVGAKYDTTYFPQDLAESPYFIVFRATKKYKASQLADIKVNYATEETEFGTIRGAAIKDDGSEGGILEKVGSALKTVGNYAKKIEAATGLSLTQPAHSFALPIPNNLGTGYNAQYNNVAELGAVGSLARTAAEGFSNESGSIIKDIVDAVKNASNENITKELTGLAASSAIAAAAQGAVPTAFAGLLAGGGIGAGIGLALGALGPGISRGLGVARNPHLANVFTGVGFRKHNFQYKLIAKNEKESEAIRDMIRNFKYHMAPEYTFQNHVFNYPSQFQIILRAGDYLYKIGDSVLSDFEVNYTGEGAPYFFEDTNAPYSVTMSLSFTEDTIVTKKEIREGR